MNSPEAWLWWKHGDCLEEGAALAAKFVTEVGQNAAADDVHVRRTRTPEGQVITFLAASDPWWHEQIRVHPNGWRGASLSEVARRFDL